jgi:succinate dehydrogenase / fumarate reductase cytochrome b subunit
VTTQRPVFLDVSKMRFPITAVISICHRLSGVLLFLFVPLAIYLLGASITSVQSFQHLKIWLHNPGIGFLIWLMLSATSFHLLAGIRHLLMDCGLFEHLSQAKVTAYVVITLTIVCMILLGVWIW